ncbi:MAG: NADP-dependent oxidoreductase [Acidibrevibacterium sp.]|jgi:NADPH-dependent curcumin reductase CurA|uniref:NADP-dependent oxidoreductase n=1 Tax=Acidibrevibacterium fodinaquatile TaxID=1969806 RepID=UPI0023A885CD|nr:NADP-dependent oxidoreductase [Acidibrevibacterium fodinaquatile]MCA7120995.1 NADP-dependent oxidoreductase [Acidibrevibacterium fodinaquatile]
MSKRQVVVLRRRPVGAPTPDIFAIEESAMPEPAEGQVLTRTLFLSIDPYMRGRLSDAKSYAAPVPIGGMMEGETVGEVIASRDPGFAPGDVVVGPRGWASHLVAPAKAVVKLPKNGAPLSTYLGVLGMPGTTAYSGMTDIGQPKAGETVVISAASGAVGAVAGQLAKRAGARVVGVAGGPEKCLFVQETLGFDECIDHRTLDLKAALNDACPNGIDVYFENVGGDLQRLVFPRLNAFGRVVMCGMVAEYNDTEPRPGPNLMMVVRNRLRIQGLIVSDKPERFAEWRALATPWVLDGSLKYREDIVDGLENAPDALIGILGGRNFGKLLVRVGAAPA